VAFGFFTRRYLIIIVCATVQSLWGCVWFFFFFFFFSFSPKLLLCNFMLFMLEKMTCLHPRVSPAYLAMASAVKERFNSIND
jgi:hypothetical protein